MPSLRLSCAGDGVASPRGLLSGFPSKDAYSVPALDCKGSKLETNASHDGERGRERLQRRSKHSRSLPFAFQTKSSTPGRRHLSVRW